MTTPGPNGWLLDTNILIHLARRDRTGVALRAGYDIESGCHPAYVCVVSHGEAESLAPCNGWGPKRRRTLETVLAKFSGPIDLSSRDVIEAYAWIDSASRSVGRRMGKNDLWIAAAT